jgi:nucleotide-binding universal stress UspA family protein
MFLIAYDGSEDAKAAIRYASGLRQGAAVRILVVWETFAEVLAHSGGLMAPGVVDFDAIDKASEEAAGTRADEGVELARSLGLEADRAVRARTTSVAREILDEAERSNAETIVMGTRGLTGLKSVLLGSVSHAVLNHADRAVMVVPSPNTAKERAARLQ